MYNFFKGVFGIPGEAPGTRSPDNGNEFRNPIWGDYTSDDEDDFRSPNNGFGFDVFSDPIAIHSFFEQQMDEMMRQFGQFGLNNHSIFQFSGDNNKELTMGNEPQSSQNLRDSYLKSGFSKSQSKQDVDLDGKIQASDINKFFNSEEKTEGSRLVPAAPTPKFFSRSVVIQKIRKPDGTIETKQTVRDSTGKEETTITQELPEGNVSPRFPEDIAGSSIFKKFFPYLE